MKDLSTVAKPESRNKYSASALGVDVKTASNAMKESIMEGLSLSNVLIVTGALLAAPALAQTSPDSASVNPMTVQTQRSDSGNSVYSPATTDETVVAAQKQETQGAPGGAQPPQYGAAWARSQD